jgi:hypothetical protein
MIVGIFTSSIWFTIYQIGSDESTSAVADVVARGRVQVLFPANPDVDSARGIRYSLDELRTTVDPEEKIQNLSVAGKQMVRVGVLSLS